MTNDFTILKLEDIICWEDPSKAVKVKVISEHYNYIGVCLLPERFKYDDLILVFINDNPTHWRYLTEIEKLLYV